MQLYTSTITSIALLLSSSFQSLSTSHFKHGQTLILRVEVAILLTLHLDCRCVLEMLESILSIHPFPSTFDFRNDSWHVVHLIPLHFHVNCKRFVSFCTSPPLILIDVLNLHLMPFCLCLPFPSSACANSVGGGVQDKSTI